MSLLSGLSAFVFQPLINATANLIKVDGGVAQKLGEMAVNRVLDHFTNHSERLNQALGRAHDLAWQTLEFALAGDSLLDLVARADRKAFREQVRIFLNTVSLDLPGDGAANFRGRCLDELRRARKEGLLGNSAVDVRSLRQKAGELAQFSSPAQLLDAERIALTETARQLSRERYPCLIQLLELRPAKGSPILVVAIRYFFRREVAKDEILHRELQFDRLENLAEQQEEGFANLENALQEHGQQLEGIRKSLDGSFLALGEQVKDLTGMVKQLLETRQLGRRPIGPGDSMSIHNEEERKLVGEVLKRYRVLPEDLRRERPQLLMDVGKATTMAGIYDQALSCFSQAAHQAVDAGSRAEAHYNAYQVALQKRDWVEAGHHLQQACQISSGPLAPFPMEKYQLERILGAGGFGVVFLCRDRDVDKRVVIKALLADNLDRNCDSVLNEARALNQIQHPAVVKLIHCDYVERNPPRSPYLVMEYFEGTTLEEHVRKNGPLSLTDFPALLRPIAGALLQAHDKGIFHRDVKPSNILIRREAGGWQVRLIDFGLALKQELTKKVAPGQPEEKTLAGATIAGTLDYAAPEQMGRLPGVTVGPRADVFGFAKTCCFALFGTANPLKKHWAELPSYLDDLLNECLEPNPDSRPESLVHPGFLWLTHVHYDGPFGWRFSLSATLLVRSWI